MNNDILLNSDGKYDDDFDYYDDDFDYYDDENL